MQNLLRQPQKSNSFLNLGRFNGLLYRASWYKASRVLEANLEGKRSIGGKLADKYKFKLGANKIPSVYYLQHKRNQETRPNNPRQAI